MYIFINIFVFMIKERGTSPAAICQSLKHPIATLELEPSQKSPRTGIFQSGWVRSLEYIDVAKNMLFLYACTLLFDNSMSE